MLQSILKKLSYLVLLSLVAIPFFIFSSDQRFDRDFLNLKNSHPEFFKAYSNIGAEEAWKFLDNKINLILNSVSIGIIDTGVDAEHPEFKERLDFGNTPPELKIDREWGGHGTEVAGIIGANNLSFWQELPETSSQMNGIVSGVRGLDYQLEIRKEEERGNLFDSFSSIYSFVKTDASIINMSFVFPNPNPWCQYTVPWVEMAFSAVMETMPNTLFIESAGDLSKAPHNCSPPATLGHIWPNLIVVGGTKLNDQRFNDSDYGIAVNISAPAEDIYAPAPRNQGSFPPQTFDYDPYFSGTSASAPFVTGTAAILKSLENEYKNYKPDLVMNPATIKEILQKSADPIKTDQPLGSGCFDPNNNPQGYNGCRLNAYKAISWYFPPTPVTLNPSEVSPQKQTVVSPQISSPPNLQSNVQTIPQNQDEAFWQENSHLPGQIKGIGKHFEIKDKMPISMLKWS